jgi:N-acetylglucosamine kinase-like BadF-type ATPase
VGEQKRYLLGIDGGGTKTHAILVGLDGTVVTECLVGPSNLHKLGVDKAAQSLFDAITECCKKAGCTSEELVSIVIGAAGAGRAAEKTALVDRLMLIGTRNKFLLKTITIESDARIALEAAFAGAPGVVLISGTGSIALYRTEEGQLIRAGGWGDIIGDEGSGFAISRDALNAVMRQHDGRSEKTLLTKKALQYFGVDQVDQLITKIYHDDADIAAFAPDVFDACNERDRVAYGVLVRNSNELVELVRVLVMQVRPKKKLPMCMMGGLLESENVYSKMVKEKIVHALPHVVVQKPKFSAAFGAAILGLSAFR